jgi:hypothetical protein
MNTTRASCTCVGRTIRLVGILGEGSFRPVQHGCISLRTMLVCLSMLALWEYRKVM